MCVLWSCHQQQTQCSSSLLSLGGILPVGVGSGPCSADCKHCGLAAGRQLLKRGCYELLSAGSSPSEPESPKLSHSPSCLQYFSCAGQNAGREKELSPPSRDAKCTVANKEWHFFPESSFSLGEPGKLGWSNVAPAQAGAVPASHHPFPGTAAVCIWLPAPLRGTAT